MVEIPMAIWEYALKSKYIWRPKPKAIVHESRKPNKLGSVLNAILLILASSSAKHNFRNNP